MFDNTKKNIPHYLQLDAMDCGPTCLRMIAKYYGKNYSLQTLRERSFLQLLQGNPHSRCAEPDGFRRVTDAQHGYPLACDEGAFAERLQRIVLAVISGYHTQAGGAAVHRIQLEVVGEGLHAFYGFT